MVVAYPVSRTSKQISKVIVTAPYITLANLLAGRELVPEFLHTGDSIERIRDAADRLLTDESARATMIEGLDHVRASLVGLEPSENAAREILALLEENGV
jgi:lipid-A-disaccharide synthase